MVIANLSKRIIGGITGDILGEINGTYPISECSAGDGLPMRRREDGSFNRCNDSCRNE